MGQKLVHRSRLKYLIFTRCLTTRTPLAEGAHFERDICLYESSEGLSHVPIRHPIVYSIGCPMREQSIMILS